MGSVFRNYNVKPVEYNLIIKKNGNLIDKILGLKDKKDYLSQLKEK